MFESFPDEGLIVPIFENAEHQLIAPETLDARLVMGWRHFGSRFFRSNFAIHEDRLCGIIPLRLRIPEFQPTKSQRRILRRNADLNVQIVPAVLTDESHALFERHKTRFKDNIPESLLDFVDPFPSTIPCDTRSVEVRDTAGQLIAVSYFDLGATTASGVYAMFSPDQNDRSLGVLTLLLEIAFAASLGKSLYYLGYSYTVPSSYDYKYRFQPLEGYDWNIGWKPLTQKYNWSRVI